MKQNSKLFRFDWIRGLAMIFVIITHFNETLINLNMDSPCIHLFMGKRVSFSQMGVILFLLMSGTLSVMSLERGLPESGKMEKRAVLTYYKKRMLSILPLYYLAYIVAYIVFMSPDKIQFHGSMIFTLFGLDGYLSLYHIPTFYLVGEWFIGMIIICYLVCPLLYQAIRKYPKITFCVLVIYYLLVMNFYPFARNKETDAMLRVVDFAIGMYFGIYVKKIPRAVAAIALAITVVFCSVGARFDYMYSVLIQGVALYCILWFVGDFLQTISVKPIAKLKSIFAIWAKYSFAVYMIHKMIIDQVLTPFEGNAAGVGGYVRLLGCSAVLMVALGVILFSAEKYIMQNIGKSEKRS